MKKKVIVKIGYLNGENYKFDVGFSASNYGGGSPCNTEEEIQEAINHYIEWIKKEGDIPVIVELRYKQTTLI